MSPLLPDGVASYLPNEPRLPTTILVLPLGQPPLVSDRYDPVATRLDPILEVVVLAGASTPGRAAMDAPFHRSSRWGMAMTPAGRSRSLPAGRWSAATPGAPMAATRPICSASRII